MGQVIALPGIRPLYFNIIEMPKCEVVAFRRAFRVSASRIIDGDFHEIVKELRGMRLVMRGCGIVVRPVAQSHDYYDVLEVWPDESSETGVREELVLRLFVASSKEHDMDRHASVYA